MWRQHNGGAMGSSAAGAAGAASTSGSQASNPGYVSELATRIATAQWAPESARLVVLCERWYASVCVARAHVVEGSR